MPTRGEGQALLDVPLARHVACARMASLTSRPLARAMSITLALSLGWSTPAASHNATSPPEVADPEPATSTTGDAKPSLRAAIAPLEIDGTLNDADIAMLTEQLVEGLRRGNFEVVSPQDVTERTPGASRCQKPRCLRELAIDHAATHVVRATIRIHERDYEVELALFDGRTGEPLARSGENCEICGVSDAGRLIATEAATLRTKLDSLAEGPPALAVTSRPSGATVTLDGELVGTTPFERPMLPGKRDLRITAPGYISIEREVTFVAGVTESLNFDLDKVPSRLPARPWGYISLVFGIAAIGGAATFAALRDTPYRFAGACEGEDNIDEDGDCRTLWNTEWHVLGFALGGAALTTLGIAILLSSTRRQAKERHDRSRADRGPRVQVGWGPAGLQARF